MSDQNENRVDQDEEQFGGSPDLLDKHLTLEWMNVNYKILKKNKKETKEIKILTNVTGKVTPGEVGY